MTTETKLVGSDYVKNLFGPESRPSNLLVWRWVQNGTLPKPLKMRDRRDRNGRPCGRNYWSKAEVDAAFAKRFGTRPRQ